MYDQIYYSPVKNDFEMYNSFIESCVMPTVTAQLVQYIISSTLYYMHVRNH